MSEPKTDQTEMKRLSRCGLHDDCRVDYDGAKCPVCDMVFALGVAKGFIKGQRKRIAQLKKLEGENNKLQSQIFELEDQLVCTTCGGSKTVECSCLEPKRPDRHGSYNCKVPCPRCDGSQELPCPECQKKEARP